MELRWWRLDDLAILAGAIQIGFVCALLLWSAALFAVAIPISWFHLPLAALTAGAFGWWVATELFPQTRARAFAWTFAGSVIAFCLFVLVERMLYDVSWDGQAYHAEAIIQLAGGWNPIRGELPSGLAWANVLTFYTKGPWICAAAVYALTGSLEAGKCFHLLLMTACGLFAFAAVSNLPNVSRRWVVIVSGLLALNPVTLAQMHTYYVDGLLLSLITIGVSLLLLFDSRPHRVLLVLLACAVVLTINVKLNGPIYLAIIAGGYCIWDAWRKRPSLELAVALFAGGLVGGAFVGFNPFISQFASRLSTEGWQFLLSDWLSLLSIQTEAPANIRQMNRFAKLFLSLVSSSDIAPIGSYAQLKVPFTVSMAEIRAFAVPDVRIAGFGPLFGGALLLVLVLLGVVIIRYRGNLLRNNLLVLSVLTMISAFPNPEMWWARFAPQVWLAAMLVLMAGKSLLATHSRWLPIALATTIAINVAIVYLPNVRTRFYASRGVAEQLAELRHQPTPLLVAFNEFAATRQRFQQHRIRYVEVDAVPCAGPDRRRVSGSEAVFCRQ